MEEKLSILRITSKNALGWLKLIRDIIDDELIIYKIDKYLGRTDIVRRQKELDNIFGGDNGRHSDV